MPAKKLTIEQFITRAREVHGDLYSYELVDYKNSHTKVKIVCSEHGVFEQIPANHIGQKQGCPVCGREAQAKTRVSIAKSEFTTKSTITHKSKYDYSLVDYKNNSTKVKILCPIHGEFLQSPASHLNGNDCPVCGNETSGFTRTKFKDKCEKNNNGLGILYIIGCWDDDKTEVFVKIGITSRSIKQRYSGIKDMPYNYKILHEIVGSPEYIYNLETLLHKKSKNYSYMPITSFAGHATECFIADKDYLTNLNIYMKELVPF